MSESPDDDLLPEILAEYRLHARVWANPRVCGAWRLNTTGLHRAGFHLVVSGCCWLHLEDGHAPHALGAGDLVFLSRDSWHVLSPEIELDGDNTRLETEGDGPRTEIICGAVEFEDPAGETLLQALPHCVLIRSSEACEDVGLPLLARLMATESQAESPGRQTVLDRLSDVLLILVLRHLMAAGDVRSGLLAGLANPQLRRALVCIHREYLRPWQLEALAARAGLSRSVFARQFVEVVGDTPMNYLARWCMHQAEVMLQDRRRSVAEVAETFGYASEAAFRRAFKRTRGKGPGAVRRLPRRKPGVPPPGTDTQGRR